MEYQFSLASQSKFFLLCIGFGFFLGVLYDIFRIVRLLVSGKRVFLLAQDILYCLCCTILTFFFFLSVSDGGFHTYGLLGEILGWLLYYVSFGSAALRATDWFVRVLRRCAAWIVHIFCLPARIISRFLRFVLGEHKKTWRKCKKYTYFHLKKAKHLVYNKGIKMKHESEK
ncbi:MAG: spore cortex biosynthesis protein YabQ [Oscillospiraceae bacterium]|jgi:spore cortex biosynthesis protein YabQ|nr:spore cortex biosynthesis protein YabQ [Oscillospiraceae bacterium]